MSKDSLTSSFLAALAFIAAYSFAVINAFAQSCKPTTIPPHLAQQLDTKHQHVASFINQAK